MLYLLVLDIEDEKIIFDNVEFRLYVSFWWCYVIICIYILMDWFIMWISLKKDNYKIFCKCLDKVIVRFYVYLFCFGKCGFINDFFMVDFIIDSYNKIRK